MAPPQNMPTSRASPVNALNCDLLLTKTQHFYYLVILDLAPCAPVINT